MDRSPAASPTTTPSSSGCNDGCTRRPHRDAMTVVRDSTPPSTQIDTDGTARDDGAHMIENRLPGPRGAAQLAVLRRLLRDPAPVLDELVQRYGPVIGLGAAPMRLAIIGDPELLQAARVRVRGGPRDAATSPSRPVRTTASRCRPHPGPIPNPTGHPDRVVAIHRRTRSSHLGQTRLVRPDPIPLADTRTTSHHPPRLDPIWARAPTMHRLRPRPNGTHPDHRPHRPTARPDPHGHGHPKPGGMVVNRPTGGVPMHIESRSERWRSDIGF